MDEPSDPPTAPPAAPGAALPEDPGSGIPASVTPVPHTTAPLDAVPVDAVPVDAVPVDAVPVDAAPVRSGADAVAPDASAPDAFDASATDAPGGGVAGEPAPRSSAARRLVARLDALQQRIRPVAFVVAVARRFGDDRAGRKAAQVAYYGFFSLFPAMLVLVTVLGFVLEGRPEWREELERSAIAQFPIIGDSIVGVTATPLTGHGAALAIGLVGALWAGMGAMQAVQDAMNDLWEVPRDRQPKFLLKRIRSLLMLVLIAGLLIASGVLSQIATLIGLPGRGTQGLLIAGSIVLDVAVFWVAFRLTVATRVPWRQLLPGAVVAGCAYYLLQLLGQWYVTRVLNGAEATYGTFAVVIGLLSWLHLQAQITMFGAEVNVVAAKKLWPRSLLSDADPEAGDGAGGAGGSEPATAPVAR